MRRAAALLFLYPLILATLTSCERSADSDADQPPSLEGSLFAVVGPPEGHPQRPGILGGAARYLRGMSAVRLEYLTPRDATSGQLRQTVQRVLEQHPAAICIYVTDPRKVRTSIDLAAAENVLVVTMGTPGDDPRVYGHVGVAIPDAAALLATNLKQIAGEGRTYLLVHDSGHNDLATRTYRRFITTAHREHDPQVLRLLRQLPDPDEQRASRDRRSQTDMVAALLELFPNASLLVTLNPDVWLIARAGWERKLRELNPGFRFVTLAAVPALWHYLGTPADPGSAAALVGPLDGDIGYAAIEMAVQGLFGRREASRRRLIECEIVTTENLPDFARRYSEAANGLDVSKHLPKVPTTLP